MTAALILLMSGPSFAQEWIQYASKDRFLRCQFPGRAEGAGHHLRRRNIDITLPGRVYSADERREPLLGHGGQLRGRRENPHRASRAVPEEGWRGRCLHERLAWRGARVDRLRVVEIPSAEREGHPLRVGGHGPGRRTTAAAPNPDGSRTFAAIYRHGTRLYILEGTVPKGAPAPGLFQQSLHVP